MTRLDILVLFLILKEKLSVFHHFILFSCGLSQVAFIMFRYISSVPMLRGFFFFSWTGVGFCQNASMLHLLRWSEKEMATHSSILAWRIPGTGEPGGLPSMGSHRVRHDWNNLAAAAAALRWSSDFYHSFCQCAYYLNCLKVLNHLCTTLINSTWS